LVILEDKNMFKKITVVVLLLGLNFIFFNYSQAATVTRYVATTGTDSGACTNQASPCRTINYGISQMSGGDTLIIGNGTYTSGQLKNVPNGNSGSDGVAGTADDIYTTIQAQSDFGVLIDGSAWANSYTHALDLYNNSYVKVRGFRIKMSQAHDTNLPVIVQESNHIKLVRIGASYAGSFGNVASFSIGPGNDYVLVEESYAYGGARYQFLVYQSDHTVMRRNVARLDYWDSNYLQAAIFTNYDSIHTVWQNNIAIDTDGAICCSGHHGMYGGFFNENKENDHPDTSESFYGNIVLSTYPDSFTGFWDAKVSGSHVYQDNIVWGSTGGFDVQQGPGDVGSITASNLTVGATTDTYNGPNGNPGKGTGISVAVWPGSMVSNLVTNSIFVNNHSYGVADRVNGDYNSFYGNGSNYGGYYTPTPGAHDIVSHNVIYKTTTNSGGSLKYLPRGPESGSTLSAAGQGGGRIGAQVLWKIGVDGTLYGENGYNTVRSPANGYGSSTDSLWPFPNEAMIKSDMASYSGSGSVGTRGFAANGNGLYGGPLTLTSYIWEYLGNACPADICGGGSTPPSTPKTGDLNSDNAVDILDYNLLVSHFGQTGSGVVGDINSSSKVDIFDFNLLVANFGR
jgi:hypothetical protein